MKNGKRTITSLTVILLFHAIFLTNVSAQEINHAGELVLESLDGIDKPLADFEEEDAVLSAEETVELETEIESDLGTEQKVDLSEQTIHVKLKENIFSRKKNMAKSRSLTSSEAPSGYNDPDSAVFYSSGLFGSYVNDVANAYENWYCLEMTERAKLSIYLSQPGTGDYDIYLYKLEGTSLINVSYSAYSGLDEQLSYVGDLGMYYLRVVPYTAARHTNSTYSFYTLRIDMLTQYDSGESDDYLFLGKPYTDSINVNQTIDNYHDVDSFKLTVNNAKDYSISLNNVPENAQYAFLLYNSDLSLKGSFLSKGSETRTIALTKGNYYIQVFSYNKGFSASKSYNLNVTPTDYYPSVAGGYRVLTKGGQTLEVTSNAAYLNGSIINLNWDHRFQTSEDSYYTRTQGIHTTSNTALHTSSVKVGTFTGVDVSSTNAVRLAVDNVWYSYYYFQSGGGHIYDTVHFNDGEYIYIYIDADTGKVIDTDINYYYVALGNSKSFD